MVMKSRINFQEFSKIIPTLLIEVPNPSPFSPYFNTPTPHIEKKLTQKKFRDVSPSEAKFSKLGNYVIRDAFSTYGISVREESRYRSKTS